MPSTVHGALFRVLLRLYPPSFRKAYGGEMTVYFLARLERARRRGGGFGVLREWTRGVADVARTAAAERRDRSVRNNGPRRGRPHVSTLAQDLRHAFRRLRRTPVFTLSAVLILAVGIGLNAAVFGLVDTVLLRPPPFADPERFVHIYQDSDDGDPSSTAYPAYRDLAALTDVFEAVAATSTDNATWETEAGPRTVAIEYVTSSFMPVLGLTPSRGRWFSPEHDHPGAELVAVVSHRTWRTQFGADPGVIGRTIRLNSQLVTIIGVGPESYNGDAGALITDFWLSISSTPVGGPFRVANLDRREDHWYQVKARLAPGVGIERARAAVDAAALRMAEQFPELDAGRDITVFAHDEVRFHPEADGGLIAAGAGLFVVAGLVLLLACSNLANLLLVRGISRGPEMAVRQALGAGRGRVMRLMLLEALVLAAVGGAAGVAVGAWSMRFIPLLPIPAPGGGFDLGFDYRSVIFGVLVALATGLLFGLLPALRTARTDVAGALRDEGRGRTAGRSLSIVRGGLVAVQVAVSVVLIVGAGLLARSVANAEGVATGVDAEQIALLGTNLQQGGVTEGGAVVAADLLQRIAAIPGVESAALTSRLPAQFAGTTTRIVEGYDPPSGTGSVELNFAVVSRDYFETMGIPLVAGRPFTVDDHADSPPVLLVNEAAARLFWRGDVQAAVGGRIRAQGQEGAWRPVVGVVGDVKVNSLQEAPTPMMYFSAEQNGVGAFAVMARTSGDPAALLAPMRAALRETRATLPVTRLMPLEEHLGATLAGPRAVASLLGIFSLLALLLASLGVYAVVSFTVERRSQELGIRAALGAASGRLVRMVVGESLLVATLGVAAGLGISLIAARGLEGMLFGVGSVDGVTFGGAALVLLAAAGAAAFLPARRAARTDPVEVLRSQ